MLKRPLRVLVLGSGGREHALCLKIAQSPRLQKLFCAPGSDAISQIAECAALDILKPAAVVDFCEKNSVDLVVIGPETSLAAGIADALVKKGVSCFGPRKKAARLESSKAFAKAFMRRHQIPTASFRVFTHLKTALKAIDLMRESSCVIKASGLAGGKGVYVCGNKKEARLALLDLMDKKIFKEAGNVVIIEERLRGPELSAMAFLDGKAFAILPFSRDYKRLKDGDLGPNTGGMGAFAPVSITPSIQKKIVSIFRQIIGGLKLGKMDYRGILYCGLMLTPEGPRVLEFNCRFGDPETQAVLPLIQSDLLEILWAVSQKKLGGFKIKTSTASSVCVICVAQGYPQKVSMGRRITGLSHAEGIVDIVHSGTRYKNGVWETNGGRVLGIRALSRELADARKKAYQTIDRISFSGMNFRRDIA